MKIVKRFSRSIAMLICMAIVIQTASCGTIIHPDRRGQTGGRIDPAIAVLDGIGLLFFIIPGAIAYAVDFSTGAIYLPGTESSDASGDDDAFADATDYRIVYVDVEDLDAATIEKTIGERTGVSVNLERDFVKEYDLDNRDAMLRAMAEVNGRHADRDVMASAPR